MQYFRGRINAEEEHSKDGNIIVRIISQFTGKVFSRENNI